MKKLALIMVLMVLIVVGCETQNETRNESSNNTTELTVFAAASMTETLQEIKSLYEEENKDVKVIFTFDSSGTLKTQIDEGAEADIFISAAQKQMDQLDPEVSENIPNPIYPSSRIDLLENQVTLVVPEGNPKNIHTFEDLQKDNLDSIALGNSDVPVGQYSKELLNSLGIWDEISEKVTFGSNVKEVTTWVFEGVVECGIVYKTDAFSSNLEIVDKADETLLDNKVIYPAGILENSKNKEVAEDFLDFLRNEEASKIFESVGFLPIK